VTEAVSFRDPEPPHDRAQEIRRDVARVLVRAPELPVSLPHFALELVDVSTENGAFALTLREPERQSDHILYIEWDAERSRARTTVRHRARDQRVRRALEILSRRLEVSVTSERWKAARAAARPLGALPLDIPLEFFRQVIPGVENTGLVRTGFRCNQDCGFCWQSRQWGDFGPEQVRLWIEDLARAGVERLNISGGEPTLDSQLAGHIRHARALGMRHICLETNAVLLARDDRAGELAQNGLDAAFVSLQSSDPAVSDRLTRAPGTHQRTVDGIRALLAAGVRVQLNAVLVPASLSTVPTLPGFIATAFNAHPLLSGLSLSYPSRPFAPSPEEDPSNVHPDVVRDALMRTLQAAVESGVAVQGVADPCGAPLCAFDADPGVVDPMRVVEPVPFRRYLAGCEDCAVRRACFGVRHEDAERWGAACIRPLPTQR
jgi:hypothetical protein